MSENVRRLTVSEFIRETKPDWEHVRTQERRRSTTHFSGATVVRVGTPMVSSGSAMDPYDEQMDQQDRQNLAVEEPFNPWDAETVPVNDVEIDTELAFTGRVGSRLPGG